MRGRFVSFFGLLAITLQPAALAQVTAFTYQGRLNDGVRVANGTYDLAFAIYDEASGGTIQGRAVTNTATVVNRGMFTVVLDFGNQFLHNDRWLEVAVRTNGGGAFVTLSPRQKLTATPYAIRASEVNGRIAGDGSGITNLSAASILGRLTNDTTGSAGSAIYAQIATNVPYPTAASTVPQVLLTRSATSGTIFSGPSYDGTSMTVTANFAGELLGSATRATYATYASLASNLAANVTFSGTNWFPAGSGLAFQEYSAATLVNGENVTVPIGTNVNVELSGNTADVFLHGMWAGVNRDGALRLISYRQPFPFTIVHDSELEPYGTNRIQIPTGTDRVFAGPVEMIFKYSNSQGRWILITAEGVEALAPNDDSASVATNVVAGGTVVTATVTASNIMTRVDQTIHTNSATLLAYGALNLPSGIYGQAGTDNDNLRNGIQWWHSGWDGEVYAPTDNQVLPQTFIQSLMGWGGYREWNPTLHIASQGDIRIEPAFSSVASYAFGYLSLGNEDGNSKIVINYSNPSVRSNGSGGIIPWVQGYGLPVRFPAYTSQNGVLRGANPGIQSWGGPTNSVLQPNGELLGELHFFRRVPEPDFSLPTIGGEAPNWTVCGGKMTTSGWEFYGLTEATNFLTDNIASKSGASVNVMSHLYFGGGGSRYSIADNSGRVPTIADRQHFVQIYNQNNNHGYGIGTYDGTSKVGDYLMSDQHIVLVDATGPKVRVDFDVANNTNTFTGGVYAPRFRSDLTTPASASAPGAVGTIVWDANYVYVCVGTNMWKRAALSSW